MQTNTDWTVITTERLDRHNDYIQVYVMRRADGNGFIVSDCGDTMLDVAQSGCDTDAPSFRARIDAALEGCGVLMELDNSFWLEADESNLSEMQDRLIRAIVAVHKIVEREVCNF